MLLAETLGGVLQLFKLPFTLGGVTFSYWEVFLFSCFTGVIIYALWRIFN